MDSTLTEEKSEQAELTVAEGEEAQGNFPKPEKNAEQSEKKKGQGEKRPFLPDDETVHLDRMAQLTALYLLLAALTGFFAGSWGSSRGLWDVLCASLFGLSGSAVAALTSCLDRYAIGFERGDGRSYPEKAKEGEGKFNRRFARWLWVRPFLGGIVAPVFIWGIGLFPGQSRSWTGAPAFTAFVAGLLAKSALDAIKRLFKTAFHLKQD